MPNWVQSYINFDGNKYDIDKVFDKIKCLNNNDRDNVFDFNRLVPMPKSLNIECSSRSNLAYAFYMLAKYDTIPHSVHMDKETVLERIKDEDDKSKIELLKLGKQIKDNVDKYGASDWYIWCVKNWGTKWNACEASRNNSSLYFQTAWSWPEHIMYKLAELCHRYNVDFSGKWADEDCGNNTGEFYTEDGNCITTILIPAVHVLTRHMLIVGESLSV